MLVLFISFCCGIGEIVLFGWIVVVVLVDCWLMLLLVFLLLVGWHYLVIICCLVWIGAVLYRCICYGLCISLL